MTKIFVKDIWSRRILESFKQRSVLEETFGPIDALDAGDVWVGPSGEESYSEAVAWAHLLRLIVRKTRIGNGSPDNIMVGRPGHTPIWIPLCSPSDLIEAMRAYATQIDDLPPHGATIVTNVPSPLR